MKWIITDDKFCSTQQYKRIFIHPKFFKRKNLIIVQSNNALRWLNNYLILYYLECKKIEIKIK